VVLVLGHDILFNGFWPNTTLMLLLISVWCHPHRLETEAFWDYLTKTAVTIVCFGKLKWNLVLWLPIDSTLLIWNFAWIRFCLLELRKCTITKGFTYATPYWWRRYFVIDVQQLITFYKNNIFLTKVKDLFSSLLGIKCTKFYLNLFRFDIFYCMMTRGLLFPDTV